MRIIAKPHVGQLELAAPLDVDLVGPVDHDVVDELVGQQGLQGAEAEHVVDVREGQVLRGRYRLLERIGAGAMGAVYLAERADQQFEKRVALKILKRGMDSKQIVARFRAEQQALALMEHDAIAKVYEKTDALLQDQLVKLVKPILD